MIGLHPTAFLVSLKLLHRPNLGIRPSYPNLHKTDSLMTFVSKDKDANKLQGVC
ncbi:MAG: hypothetical protein ACJA01_004374, partial [Saprospiraceae bacterium]